MELNSLHQGKTNFFES